MLCCILLFIMPWIFFLIAGHDVLSKIKCLKAFWKMVPFALPLPEAQGDFSLLARGWTPGGKMWGPPYEWVPLEFLSLNLVHTEPPVIWQLQCSFLYLTLVPMEVILCIHLSVSPILWATVCTMTSLLLWTYEEWLIFSLFSFLHC